MIQTVWPYLAVVLLAAGLFPSLEQRFAWRLFNVLPPVVLTYLAVTALAVGGLWTMTPEIQAAQKLVTAYLLPALLFLLMVSCDLKAILALGPRVLAVFACAMLSILLGILVVYLLFRTVLPEDGWKMLAALTATWTGGSANLVAVKEIVGLSASSLPAVLLADALVYSLWVVILFSMAAAAPAFDRWTGAAARERPKVAGLADLGAARPGSILLWLGIALFVALGASYLAKQLPETAFITTMSWTVLFATVAGLIVARTSLARLPGSAGLGAALLYVLIAVLASQSNFHGLGAAPLFILCAACVLVIHVVLLTLAARLFRFDLHLSGISSLAQIGGPATAPLLAAVYSPVLVPVAVLLAMLGLVVGTGMGLFMAKLLSTFVPGAA